MSTKIVKTLKFPNNSDEFQINARYLNGEEMPTTLPNPKALTVGSKTYTGSSAVTITAADLGLASAMKFLGTSKTAITDGATTNPITIGSTSTTVTSGNVVLYGSKEFVWTGSAWEELGNEGSYKVVQTAVASPSASGTDYQFIDSISQNTQGVITATKRSVREASASQSGLMTKDQFSKLAGISEDADKVEFSQSLTSGTKVGTITINGTGTDLFAPTNTNYYHTTGSWSGLTYTATANGGAGALAFTIPTGTTATTVSRGDHTHNYAGSSSAGGAATSANKLATARTISLSGDASGSITFDGSADKTLTVTVADDSHNHVIDNVDGLQTALDNKLSLDGGTVNGDLSVNDVLKNGRIFNNVATFQSTSTVDEIVIKTKIPYQSSNEMPLIHLKGYAYGEASPIEITVAFYIYNDAFYAMGATSTCPWKPTIYLSSYTQDSTRYVALSFSGKIYFSRFVVDMIDIWFTSTRDYSSGWTTTVRDYDSTGSTASVIPTANKVTVPYKNIANDISGNAATATRANYAKFDNNGNQIDITYATKAQLNTDNIEAGTETWYFNCGTATTVLN